jgi:hypothetical protein
VNKANDSTNHLLIVARMLADRLERLSADSPWAHRASGLRGSLLRVIEGAQKSEHLLNVDRTQLEELLALGFEILEKAAREINAADPQ